ncbi:Calcium-transporting ATPase 2-like protein 3 [Paraphaeosphaeria sporulosa]
MWHRMYAEVATLSSEGTRTVVAGQFGAHGHTEPRTGSQYASDPDNIGAISKHAGVTSKALQTTSKHERSNTDVIDHLISGFSADVVDLLKLFIGTTTTALETDELDENGQYVGCTMESALLDSAKRLLWALVHPKAAQRLSSKFRLGIQSTGEEPAARLLRASGTIVADPKCGLDAIELSLSMKSSLQQNLNGIESVPLQTIRFGFKDSEAWP